MAVPATIYIPGSAGVGKYLNTVLSGKSLPPNTARTIGDFWLDTRPGVYVLYGPKQGDKWPSQGQELIGGMGPGGGSDILLGHGAPPDDPAPSVNSLYFDLDSATVYPAV